MPTPKDDKPTRDTHQQALVIAREMLARAHAPYSNYRVAAVIEDENGKLHGGCNIENPAYPATLCAEAAALANMVTAGGKQAQAVWVMVKSPPAATPCGTCRQRLMAFAKPDTPVMCLTENDASKPLTLCMSELLPAAFDEASLKPNN